MAMTVGSMEVLRGEHRELQPNIEALSRLAGEVTTAAPDVLRVELERVLDFMHGHLLPHAAAEEAVLYPRVAQAIAAADATATMRRDHEEVRRLVDELEGIREMPGGEIGPDARARVVQMLHSLHAVVTLHFAKEEEIYLPLLEQSLTGAEARTLLEEMEHRLPRP